MRITQRAVARHAIAVCAGVILALFLNMIYTSIYLWYMNVQVPPGYWRMMLVNTLLMGVPINTLVCLTVSLIYAAILSPDHDPECRCRRCGYILKGLSKLECPECGEKI